jgi:transmembrane sensor
VPVPVRDLLDEKLPEAEVKRLWNGLEAKRARAAQPKKRPWVWTLAVASAAVGAVLTFLWMRAPAPAVLHLADGTDVPSHLEARAPLLPFDDGSELTLRMGTRLDLLESTPRTFSLALRRGSAVFEVHPGGPRVWKIECGPITVEVVGTHFRVERDDAHVEVAVERGAVLVSGEPVPDHVVRLGPHQSIVVALTSADEGIRAPTTEQGRNTEQEATPVTSSQPPVSTRPLERDAPPPPAPAAPSDTPESAPSDTPPAPSASNAADVPSHRVEALLASADDARLAGRYREAANILERVVTESSGDRRAPLAEFSLGRLYLDSLGDPSRAAVHFSRALLRGLAGALEEDAYARLVEAYARAGDARAARDIADRYRARYPRGRRLDSIERWTAAPPP